MQKKATIGAKDASITLSYVIPRLPSARPRATQTLPTTLGVDSQIIVRLDKLRKQRNLTEYTGDTEDRLSVTLSTRT
jgi:hypothetical protein